jgi:hypothetical protein
MNQVPLSVSYLQALATPAIALLAAAIAWGQWQTARQKFVQDLFDRRFGVFMDVRLIASEVLQRERPSDPGLINKVVAKARFLFGEDVQTELNTMGTALRTLDHPDPASAMAARDAVHQCYDKLIPIFESYMRLDHKPPQGAIR